MIQKLSLNLDATVLGHSGCIRALMNTILGDVNTPELGGYREKVLSVNLVYGIAVHAYIDTMYKTGGHIPTARNKALELFNTIPFIPDRKKAWMSDQKHLNVTCQQVWTEFVEQESNFKLLEIQQKCPSCDGSKTMQSKLIDENTSMTLVQCSRCNGTGLIIGPATEINFKIPYYEDDIIKVYLCGTIDRIGKFTNGCYCIRDWKTTSSWEEGYFTQYELSRQLRLYTLAVKLMGQMHPDSVIGQVGLTEFRTAIDGIFLRANANETNVQMSDTFYYNEKDLAEFRKTLDDKILEISNAVRTQYFPKQGILTGACEKKFSRCLYWAVCKSNDEIAQVLLNRDFKRAPFNPLAYNK